MKKIYIPYYATLIFFIVTFIIGSFYDYQINDALFSKNDTFGLVISVIGMVPGYGVLAFLGGGFLYFALKREVNHVLWKVFFYFMAVAAFGCSVYFAGVEFFGENGFNFIGVQKFWGYFIVFPLYVGVAFFGYKITSKSTYDKLWLIYTIIALGVLISLVAGVTLIKAIFHRPRFRSLGVAPGVEFHNWWEPCSNYKELIASSSALTKEEFKSFPSGHAGGSAVFFASVLFLPYINEKYKKLSYILFGVGVCWTLLVAFARMRVGAHFLSDVSMGPILVIVTYLVARIVTENVKYFAPQVQEKQ